MGSFSFDIVSDYDKAEMNNAVQASIRDLSNRYDLKGTPAEINWLGDKVGLKVSAANDWHLETILDILRKNLAERGISTKVLDLETNKSSTSNLKVVQDVPFISGLSSDKAKTVSSRIREKFPKLKPQIMGESIRVSGSSKDELQLLMSDLRSADFEFPVRFENYR